LPDTLDIALAPRTIRPSCLAAALDAWAGTERGRFSLWLPVLMGVGVALFFSLRTEPAAWTGPAVLACGIALAALVWRRPLPRGLALGLIAAALGFSAATLATWRALPWEALPSRAVVLTATVRGVEILPDSRRLTLENTILAEGAAPLRRRLHVRLRDDDTTAVAAGDTIRLRALLRPPAPPAYPGAWDLQRDDYFSGLGGGGYALGPVTVSEHAAPVGVLRWWEGLRDAIAARFIAGLPGPDGAIAATLLTGGQSAIPSSDRAAFRDSGLAHLLAVAGLHIAIVMGVVMGLVRVLLALSERASLNLPCKQIAALAALAAGALYMLLTGMHVPIMRSFAMASLVVLGLVVGRRALSLRGLALAAAVLILIAPQEVMGVSFQMSFSAVLALIAGYEALRPLLAHLHGDGALRRTASHLTALALTSLLAGTASAPFAAYHFGHVQLYNVVANLAAVPLTAMLVMPAGLAALALMPLGLERIALIPMGWGIDAVLWIGRSVSAWPSATHAVPHIPGWGLAMLALGLAWLGLWRSRWRLAGLLALALGLASPLAVRPPDLLVSADARLIALRTADGAFVQSKGGSKFIESEWLQYWALPQFQPMPRAAGNEGNGAIACTDAACTLRPREDVPAILLVRNAQKEGACDAALVVSPEPARPCTGGKLIDRFTVWREGAQAVWLDPAGPRILSDKQARGARPWVLGPPVQHDVPKVGLPAAKTEQPPADF
jgi:competence protein ComEC